MNKRFAKNVNDVRKANPGKEIIIVMHVNHWIKTFKCITSFTDADIYVRVDMDEKEIRMMPKYLYFN